MRYTMGTRVQTNDGRDFGRLTGLVLDCASRAVTYLIVRQGLIFTEERVIPVEMVVESSSEATLLRACALLLHGSPQAETRSVPLDYALVGGSAGLSHAVDLPGAILLDDCVDYAVALEQQYRDVALYRMSPDTITLKEGAWILSEDDHHVGCIDSLLVDRYSGRLTHIIIAQGLLLKTRKLIPEFWCHFIGEGEVLLALDSALIADIPDFFSVR